MAKLEVQIGADSSELKTEIAKAELLIEKLRKQKSIDVKAGLDVVNLQKDINTAKAQLKGLNKSVSETGTAFSKMQKPVANGGNTLMQFSRIAQDAPFGIMGIGNNITATAESFGYLSASAGGTGNALKAVASSIMGVGGILLAVSLVTSALTYMSQNGITVGDVFDKLTGNFDETAKALTKIGQEAAKTAGEEIATVKAYLSVAKNRELSDDKRLLAVKELQDKYPAYFGNLSREKILNGEVAGAVGDVSKALMARARATAIAGKMGELATKRLILEEQKESNILDIQKQQAFIEKQRERIQKKGVDFDEYRKATLSGVVSQYKETVLAIKDLDSQSKKYQDRENQSTADSIKLLEEKVKVVKKVNSASTNFTPQVSAVQSSLQPTGLATASVAPLPIAGQLRATTQAVTEEALAMQLALNEFNDSASGIINSSISDTFANLGTVIGQGLSSGGNVLKAAGNVLLAGLGGILVDLGKMAIQVGVGLLGIKTALKTLNPALAIAGGVALIAIGSVFSNSAKGLGNSMGSGGSSGGGGISTGSSVSSPTSSNSNNSSGSFQNVVFEISGQSLIGVLSSTLDKNRRLGGGLRLAN
jgi:uncharacterized LabA/DUF88 family protein